MEAEGILTRKPEKRWQKQWIGARILHRMCFCMFLRGITFGTSS
jgi:hypothetical protein